MSISVTDFGVGISKPNLSRIFRIDDYISTLNTENQKGSGIGLILSNEFIQKKCGTILVESELGKGSKFTFTLPLNKKHQS